MGEDDVLEVVGRLEAAGVEVWLDGGWGVDALLCRRFGLAPPPGWGP
jgi:lincosamide nucleotidyltransferase A/C/D/E